MSRCGKAFEALIATKCHGKLSNGIRREAQGVVLKKCVFVRCRFEMGSGQHVIARV